MNVADHPTANRLRLLHTAASHVPRFGALLSELAPELSAQHVVCERLLDDARTGGGVDAALTRELGAVLESLAGSSAVVLCTGSTLGAAAEALGGTFGARVLRVDRPLARAAVAQGSRIVVVAALESTLEPTRQLLEEEAAREPACLPHTVGLQRCLGLLRAGRRAQLPARRCRARR